MPDLQTSAEFLGMINWLAGERQQREERREERAHEDMRQAIEAKRRINELRIEHTLKEGSKLQEQRTELMKKVGDISKVVDQINKNKKNGAPSVGLTALVNSEVADMQNAFGVLSQRQTGVDGLLDRLASQNTALQQETDLLAGAYAERGREAELAKRGFKRREVEAEELRSKASMKSADADWYRAVHGSKVFHYTDTDKTADPVAALLNVLGKTKPGYGPTKQDYKNVGTEDYPVWKPVTTYGPRGGTSDVHELAGKALRELLFPSVEKKPEDYTGKLPLTRSSRYMYLNKLADQAEDIELNEESRMRALQRMRSILPPIDENKLNKLQKQADAGKPYAIEELELYKRAGLIEEIE